MTSVCLAQRTPQRSATNNNLGTQDREQQRTTREFRNLELERYKLVVKDEKNARGEFEFTCENKGFCDYIVDVTFTEQQNLQADVPQPIHLTVSPGTHRIFTMKKITLGQPDRFSWHYRFFKGVTNPKPDTNFAYLLPVAPNHTTRIFELYYIAKQFGGQPEPKGWYSAGFHVHKGDTVYAARSGRVTETLEQADLRDSSISYARGENFIEVYHKDNSFGRYRVFRDSSIFVHAGDWVEAGQPIGIAGGDKYASGPQVQFSVYYNHNEDVMKDGESTGITHHWAYVPLKFWTKGQGQGPAHLTNHATYTSEHPADVITKEMTKKEAKKWMEFHKTS
jgi:hypothetical protein